MTFCIYEISGLNWNSDRTQSLGKPIKATYVYLYLSTKGLFAP